MTERQPLTERHSPTMRHSLSKRRRFAAVAAAIVIGLVAIFAWAIPNVAGRALVEVRAVVVASDGGPLDIRRTVVFGDGSEHQIGRLGLAVRVTGRYPLPVVVDTAEPPLRVELRAIGEGGASHVVLDLSGDSRELGQAEDSGDDVARGRVVLVRPGSIDLPIGPRSGVAFVDDHGVPLPAGRYTLRAWAFGQPSGTLQLILVN
jgi:hypothetical protein